jgi:hypothetical protein
MPGFAFIAGVNITDKNVREIVFHNTPAEVAYVVAVSIIVHFVFTLAPVSSVNPGAILGRYVEWNPASPSPTGRPAARELADIVSAALGYFIVSAVAGGVLGIALSKAIERWDIRFFVKHRWMTGLVGGGEREVVFARALTKPAYKQKGKDGEETELAVVVEGMVRDCYFTAEGTLLYLVFISYQERAVRLGDPLFDAPIGSIEVSSDARPSRGADTRRVPRLLRPRSPAANPDGGILVLEGSNIARVQYARRRTGMVTTPAALSRIAKAIKDDPE